MIEWTDLPVSLRETHEVQLFALLGMAAFDVIMLVMINSRKRSAKEVTHDDHMLQWTMRRNLYWFVTAACLIFAVSLDARYGLSPGLIAPKAYVFAFPLGLLDLHFSQTRGVAMTVICGAALWCSTDYIRQLFVSTYLFPGDRVRAEVPVIRDISLHELNGLLSLGRELVRFIVTLPFIGILSDLVFSPMHRLMHHPAIYKENHKVHHEYTNKLTSLVLYHGTLLDDFLMPFSTVFGGVMWIVFLSMFSLEQQAYSSVTLYLIVFNTLLSHAHDIRCARLMAPLPDGLNFVAYHWVHHISPCNNYGLTEPSDLIWDRILGVNTIANLSDFENHGNAKVVIGSSTTNLKGSSSKVKRN